MYAIRSSRTNYAIKFAGTVDTSRRRYGLHKAMHKMVRNQFAFAWKQPNLNYLNSAHSSDSRSNFAIFSMTECPSSCRLFGSISNVYQNLNLQLHDASLSFFFEIKRVTSRISQRGKRAEHEYLVSTIRTPVTFEEDLFRLDINNHTYWFWWPSPWWRYAEKFNDSKQ